MQNVPRESVLMNQWEVAFIVHLAISHRLTQQCKGQSNEPIRMLSLQVITMRGVPGYIQEQIV